MKKFLFVSSIICSAFLCIFLFSKISLNGYKADFYFFLATLFLNSFSFLLLRKTLKLKWKPYINLSIVVFLIIGLSVFLWVDTLQVDKVYEPADTKYNLYASLSGWYKRAYYKKHRSELCNDGVLWHTKVPYYFPIIEIETSRDECHKVDNDSTYLWLFKHIPE